LLVTYVEWVLCLFASVEDSLDSRLEIYIDLVSKRGAHLEWESYKCGRPA